MSYLRHEDNHMTRSQDATDRAIDTIDTKKSTVSIESGLSYIAEINKAFGNLKIYTSNLSTMINTEVPKIDFIQSGFKLGTIGFLNAPGATGKSFFAIQTAMSLASCNRYKLINNLNYKSAKVAYISGEDDLDTINIRMRAISKNFDEKTIKIISENLTVIDVIESGLKFLDFNSSNKIEKNTTSITILDTIAKHSDLIILDTLSRFHLASENDNGEMSRLLNIFETIAKVNNCSILILHHNNKSSMNGKNDLEQNSARGASSLISNSRYLISLNKMSKEDAKLYFGKEEDPRRNYHIRCSFPKINYTAPIPDKWLKKGEGGTLSEVSLETFSASKRGTRYEH